MYVFLGSYNFCYVYSKYRPVDTSMFENPEFRKVFRCSSYDVCTISFRRDAGPFDVYDDWSMEDGRLISRFGVAFCKSRLFLRFVKKCQQLEVSN